MANNQKISSIIQLATGKKTKIAQKYIDGSLPISFLSGFSHCLAVSESRLINMTLDSYAGVIYEHSSLRSKRRGGILNAGETRHHLFFQQYCPACLREGTPYYRKIWRLSCMTICHIHKCKLLDRCSGCSHPVLVMANDAKNKHLPYSGDFTDCHQCGENLSRAMSAPADSRMIDEAVFYLLVMNSGFTLFHSNRNWTYSFVFFSLIRLLMKLVYDRIGISSGFKASSPDIDSIDCEGRYLAAKVIVGAFDKWPDSFINLCEMWSIRYYELDTIKKILGYVPFIIERDVKPIIYAPNLPPSEESILSAINVMRKNKLRINQTTLNNFMGYKCSETIIAFLKKEKFL